MSARLAPATLRTIQTAPSRQLQAVAEHRADRLYTESETDFLLAALRELGRRSRRSRAVSLAGGAP